MSQETKYYFPKENNINSVVILLHGFNLKPSRMTSIAYLLQAKGSIVLNGTLSGHEGDYKKLQNISDDRWLNDTTTLLDEGVSIAQKHNIPLYFVGFSLGCLTMLNLLKIRNKPIFSKMFLIAPAIDIHLHSRLIQLLNIFPINFNIISLSNKDYRVHPSLPLSSYNQLYKNYYNVTNCFPSSWKIPTTVFMDPRDELVSLKKIKKRATLHQVSQWSFIEADTSNSELKPSYRHLCIDESSMGSSTWKFFQDSIFSLFYSNN